MRIAPIFMVAVCACAQSAFAYGPIDCVQDVARGDTEISTGLATTLCSRASSPAVPQCYVQSFALDRDLSRGLAIKLCRGAASLEPLSCYQEIFAVDVGMSRGIAIDLCSATPDALNTINCYVDAARKGMSRGGAVDLCGARGQ
jgi:hypothetical protein